MKTHEWHERTADGDVRYIRAVRHAGQWRVQAKLKGDEHWAVLDPVPRRDLEQLRDVLWRKYQRRRLGYGDIEQVDRLIAAAPETAGDVENPESDSTGGDG